MNNSTTTTTATCSHITEGSPYCTCSMCKVCGYDLNTCSEHANDAEHLYLSADELRSGDMLPTKSRWPVETVTVVPGSHVTVTHLNGFNWHTLYGGPEFGFGAVHVERMK